MIATIGVIIPAVNEQATVGRCLDTLMAAGNRLREVSSRAVDIRVMVVLDSCVDATAEIVHRHREVEAIACTVGRAGAARAVGARALLSHFDRPPGELWLANTDADSLVPPDWLTTHLEEADRGADLVLGTVLPDAGLAPVTERAWFGMHSLREGHPHVHGANFGIRADVYTALGGWPQLATGEDVTLAEQAVAAGHLRITRTARIPVRTSVRLTGRAPHGFAAYLRALPAAQEELAG